MTDEQITEGAELRTKDWVVMVMAATAIPSVSHQIT